MKRTFKQKKAFTLIELLIVIAIIGILFIVLVSKVDFATDKAKATGVQTDFRSFQAAFELVSKEHAGFNTFGWDTGDANGNRVRDSVDVGDTDEDGVYDAGETWTGRKRYIETWTGVYTLINPADANDYSAIFDLETAINHNLDPKLHIMIENDGTISMANGHQDPWSTQYHGRYLTNASADAAAKWNTDASMTGSTGDNMDRGAMLMFSNGANQKFGTKVKVEGGIVTATVSQINADAPDNNTLGADDYVLAVVYTYTNGYGETGVSTTGFSNNQHFLTGNGGGASIDGPAYPGAGPGVDSGAEPEEPALPAENPTGTIDSYSWSQIQTLAQANLSSSEYKTRYGIELGQKKDEKYVLVDLDGNAYDGFVFMFDTGTKSKINGSSLENVGGYATAEIAPQVEAFYTNLTDSELKSVIKQVTVKCADGISVVSSLLDYTCHMFLASEREVGGNTSISSVWDPQLNAEGTRFDYFTSASIRKTVGGANDWWVRTGSPAWDAAFFYVHSADGSITATSTNSQPSYEVVPAFVVG